MGMITRDGQEKLRLWLRFHLHGAVIVSVKGSDSPATNIYQSCRWKSGARSQERISNDTLMEDVPLPNTFMHFNKCVTAFASGGERMKGNIGIRLPDLAYVQ